MEETETVLTLADFGALLRERRIHKGLTEENVAAELKITSRLVKAIEEGDMESMPHAVYARGFIRAYAKLLAVDDSVTHAACALLKDPEEELREEISGERCGRLFGYIRKSRESISEESAVNGKKFDAER